MLDVILKLFTEILNEGTHWHRICCIAQGANRTTLNTVRNRIPTYRDLLDDL